MYQYWGTPGGMTKLYNYNYDKLNRLLYGVMELTPSGTILNAEQGISYDQMGNITQLVRTSTGTTQIDNLAYTYTGNQLQSIVDNSGSNTGLVAGTTNYTWDGNGNMLTDTNSVNMGQNKTVTYNLLNLPQLVKVHTGTVTYTYDALGNKLRKVSDLGGVTHTTDYIAGIEYDGATTDTLNFIQTEEGKAAKFNSSIYDYVYYLGDNLGNTRITFGTRTGSTVTYQSDDYYPFGYEINNSLTGTKNEYLYNKKELQEETQEYDYGARMYDPLAVHWNTIDPLAELSRRWSTYTYVEDNPIRMIDPDGMDAEDGYDGPGPHDPPALSSGVRMKLAELHHPIDATAIGPPTRGMSNISANSERFATTGASDDSDSILQGGNEGEGTESNAFRHALWSATITSQFGATESKEFTDAHEENPNADLSQTVFKGAHASSEADMHVDLLNNQIGQKIGASSQGLGTNAIATKVTNQYAKSGLWTATKQKDRSYKISLTKLSPKKFNAMLSRLKQLNNNGRSKAEQAQNDEQKKEFDQHLQENRGIAF